MKEKENKQYNERVSKQGKEPELTVSRLKAVKSWITPSFSNSLNSSSYRKSFFSCLHPKKRRLSPHSRPSLAIAARCWMKPLNGARPVPGPIIMMGTVARRGSLNFWFLRTNTGTLYWSVSEETTSQLIYSSRVMSTKN